MKNDHNYDVEMRLMSLVFITFQGCQILFRDELIKYAHVGFNSKLHFPLSKLSTSIVKIGPLEKMIFSQGWNFSLSFQINISQLSQCWPCSLVLYFPFPLMSKGERVWRSTSKVRFKKEYQVQVDDNGKGGACWHCSVGIDVKKWFISI